uniref:Uncharacterized protein n=1 Tax=Meloidogyne enterolobii TaxID=390850 RepID=A0A6V7TKF2_MELEN|nr:unnamed protein product [Meloidogyne enterolobii]
MSAQSRQTQQLSSANNQQKQDDPYGGFNDYDHAYDLENLYSDGNFVQAAVRSSYGRRPATSSRLGTSMPVGTAMGLRLPTAASYSQMGVKRLATGGINAHHPLPLSRARTGIAGGTAAGLRTGMPSELARPMTAIRGAGYSSAGRKSTFDKIPIQQNEDNNNLQNEENAQLEKAKKLEDQAMEQLLESTFLAERGEIKAALDKAKEATRQWRTSDNLRKSSGEQQNMDLGWCSLLCLAQQKLINGIPSEALNIYQTIVKNRSYANGHRLKINIGNIYFRKKEYTKALKYYRMALDQVPKVHQRMRAKILSNIGVAMVRLGRYEDALSSFEESLELNGRSAADYSTALNLIMAAYCLGNEEKMRESFQRLVDIPILIDENKQQQEELDVLTTQLLENDALAIWERRKRHQAEKTILLAAKIISQAIAPRQSFFLKILKII